MECAKSGRTILRWVATDKNLWSDFRMENIPMEALRSLAVSGQTLLPGFFSLELDHSVPPPATELNLESLVSKACFHAALAATGCRTGYKLELVYGSTHSKGQWKRMANGTPAIRRAVARGDQGVVERLGRIREESSLVDDVLRWSLWGSLDPKRSLWAHSAYQVAGNYSFSRPDLHHPLQERRACRAYVTKVRESMRDPSQRYQAVNEVWHWIRFAAACEDIPLLVLSYLLWREARAILESDSILGPICGDLYAWAVAHFRKFPLSERVAAQPKRYHSYGIELSRGCQESQIILCSDALGIVDPAGPFKRRKFGT